MIDEYAVAVIRDLQREQDSKAYLVRVLQQQVEQLQTDNELLREQLRCYQQHHDGARLNDNRDRT